MMKTLILLAGVLIHFSLLSQTLPLPPRGQTALSGTQVVTLITNLPRDTREEEIYNQIMSGNIPDFLRTLKTVTGVVSVNGQNKTVVYYAAADYLAVGSNDDYFLIPMTPLLAQRLATPLGCVLPTKRMVDQIYTSSICKLRPQPIPPTPQMTTVPVFKQHNDSVWSLRQPLLTQYPLGTQVGGTKKDVIISNRIYQNLNPNTPKPVVIYGWHQLNGSPIQPVYNGHGETYADYSHGVRLVKDSFFVDGVYKSYASLLADAVLSQVISDEGVILKPYYTIAGLITPVPTVFCAVSKDHQTVTIKNLSTSATTYKAFYGPNVSSLTDSSAAFTDSIEITGLMEGVIYYFRLRASGQGGYSEFSEILSAVPSSAQNPLLIVQGFDRAVTGNSKDFVKMHAPAFLQAGIKSNSATNEAVTAQLISLNDYSIVDYILGTESTADETFSSAEQELVKSFLKKGGYLFASGSEIAWDLDYRGSASDKDFIKLYLKAQYANDAPGGAANTYYTASGLPGEIFSGINGITFDNGTHGTFNVSYPDVLLGVNGSTHVMQYGGVTAQIAAVSYLGLYPAGTVPGKSVTMGFPFEAIYPESKRNQIITALMAFFSTPAGVESEKDVLAAADFTIYNFPNPFNPETTMRLNIPESGKGQTYSLEVYSINGELIKSIFRGELSEGSHSFTWNGKDNSGSNVISGVYVSRLMGAENIITHKMVLLR